MAEMVKILSTEISLSTANNVSRASVVRLFNNTNGSALITRAAGNTVIGSATLGPGAVEYHQKQPTDTLASDVAIRAVSVSYN